MYTKHDLETKMPTLGIGLKVNNMHVAYKQVTIVHDKNEQKHIYVNTGNQPESYMFRFMSIQETNLSHTC